MTNDDILTSYSSRTDPHAVDVHVGARVRTRRKLLGLSQEDLAHAIGLTFQQVQKYEKGSNRISASKLWEIAQALKTPMIYFFDGYGLRDDNAPEADTSANEDLASTQGAELAETFPRIRSNKLRRQILDLVRTLAETE